MERITISAKREPDIDCEVLTLDVITGYIEDFSVPFKPINPGHWSAVSWRADLGKKGLVEALRRLADQVESV